MRRKYVNIEVHWKGGGVNTFRAERGTIGQKYRQLNFIEVPRTEDSDGHAIAVHLVETKYVRVFSDEIDFNDF